MSHFDVYAIGNALVDTEYRVTDDFLTRHGIAKGMMTLIDEPRQQALLAALDAEFGMEKRASGGSAANTIIAVAAFGGQSFYSCKVASDGAGDFYVHDLHAAGVSSNLRADRDAGTTGTCVVMVTPDAERTMHTFLGITSDVSTQELQPESHWWQMHAGCISKAIWSAPTRLAPPSDEARRHGPRQRHAHCHDILRSRPWSVFSSPVWQTCWTMVSTCCSAMKKKPACGRMRSPSSMPSMRLRQIARQVVITRGKAGALNLGWREDHHYRPPSRPPPSTPTVPATCLPAPTCSA
jgi:hypothetical protein